MPACYFMLPMLPYYDRGMSLHRHSLPHPIRREWHPSCILCAKPATLIHLACP